MIDSQYTQGSTQRRGWRPACTQHHGSVQQPPTAAEPPYDGRRRHAHHSELNLPPQLAIVVP
eukprot:COSAG01_NODE_22508_length_852_cov_2.193891_2_plen_61_part_01